MNKFLQYAPLIADLIRGKLTAEEVPEVTKLLDREPALKTLVDSLTAARRSGERPEWMSVRSAAHSLLDFILEDSACSSDHGPPTGVLTFDSALLPAPTGIRPAEISSRRLEYSFGNMSMSVSLYTVSLKTIELIGRVSGAIVESGVSVVLQGKRRSYTVSANSSGVFRFKRIPRQSYEMKLLANNELAGEARLRI